jgi:autotransporter-associated beta strand protein
MAGGSIATAPGPTGPGTLVLNGDALMSICRTLSIWIAMDLNGSTRTFTVADTPVDVELAIAGVISNGGFTKAGPRTLELVRGITHTYTGPTSIEAGTLRVNATLAAASTILV